MQKVRSVTGLSTRQLGYWDETGLISPSVQRANGPGNIRYYSFQDIVVLKAAKRLRDSGIPLSKIRKAIAYLQSELPNTPISQHCFITDGKNIFKLTNDPKYIVDLTKGGQVTWNLDMDAIVKETEHRVRNAERTFRLRGQCERRPPDHLTRTTGSELEKFRSI
ncbi:MAG: MerR family transcriptional regulator [Bacillota bacterium]